MPGREIIETGKTVESVIEAACGKLGCSREECQWEIVSMPKKSFFGIKTTPYKVRVWVEEAEPAIPEKKEPAKAKPEAPKEQRPVRAMPESRPVVKEAPAARCEVKEPAEEKKEPVRQAREKSAPYQKHERQPGQRRESKSSIDPRKIEIAEEYLKDVLKVMGLEATLSTRQEDGGVCINIEGKGLGAIIGRRGETLDAIQYLVSLAANRIDGDYMRITIDCGDYRMKRKETLEALAKKLASQVLKTNVSRTLEPMNPFERRIIHATVSEMEGVSSISVGEEPNRRVVITSPSAKSRNGGARGGVQRRDGAPQGGSGNSSGGSRGSYQRSGSGGPPRRGRDDRNDRGGRDNRSEFKKVDSSRDLNRVIPPRPKDEPPKQTPESTVSTDKPLYTKIDLE